MTNGGFVKIYGSILQSSVWLEDPETRLLWITMLAMADQRGFVAASVGGLAHAANIPRELCEAGLVRLSSQDPDSKSKAYEGRRIRATEGGWIVLNYSKYRDMRTGQQITDAERKQKWRKLKGRSDLPAGRVPDVPDASHVSPEIHTEVEVDVELKTKTARPFRGAARPTATTTTVGTLAAGELVQQIRALKASHYRPGGGSVETISREEVERLGADVLRAYIAVGGPGRFLAATGKDIAFLNNDFGRALSDARREGAAS